MKKVLTIFLFVATLASCNKENPAPSHVEPIYTGKKVALSITAYDSNEHKIQMYDDSEGNHKFKWGKKGEKMALIERIRFKGESGFTYCQQYASNDEYSVSGNVASFTFDIDELANEIDECQYYFVASYDNITSARAEEFTIHLNDIQEANNESPDSSVIILYNSKTGLKKQGGSLFFSSPFKHCISSYIQITVKDLNEIAGVQIQDVCFECNKDLCGSANFSYSSSPELVSIQSGIKRIHLKPKDLIWDGKSFSLRFATFPFFLQNGEKFTVTVLAGKKSFSKEVTLSTGMSFPTGCLTKFTINMTGIAGETVAQVIKSDGSEILMSEEASNIFSTVLPTDVNPYELTLRYGGEEYGFATRSGNGGIGLVTNEHAAIPYRNLGSVVYKVPFDGYCVSKSCGTLGLISNGSNPLWVKSAKPIRITFDASHIEARYKIEEINSVSDLYQEDFSMMCLGGDYIVPIGGSDVASEINASNANGYEVAGKDCESLTSAFNGDCFNWGVSSGNASAEYIESRGLSSWTLSRVTERPLALQIGSSTGSGYAISPSITSNTSSEDLFIHLDISRYGTAATDAGIEIEILGNGTFDSDNCKVSRDRYYRNQYWDAVLDEFIKGADGIKFENKKLTITQQGDGSYFPRGYHKTVIPKPLSHLTLKVTGADSSTKIKLAGESGKKSHFALKGFRVTRGDCKSINGTIISSTTHYAGMITNKETGDPISGVYVSDGAHYVKTDANGVYQLVGDGQTRFIYYSLPAEYQLPLDDSNQPMFWKKVTPNSSWSRNDFKLTSRNGSSNRFNFLAVSDIHFYGTQSSVSDTTLNKFSKVTVPELNSELAAVAANGYETFLISLGDLVTNFTKQYPVIKTKLSEITLKGKPVPIFSVIGNHDHTNAGTSDLESTQDFADAFGPTDYSFNIGNAHFVCIDNVIFSKVREGGYGKEVYYSSGFTDRQAQWLVEDINSVADKANTLLVICVHIPIRYDTANYFQTLRDQFANFANVLVFSGHKHILNHYCYNEKYTTITGRRPEELTINALGGLWRASIGKAGDPNGYYVFEADGANMPKHYFKAVGYSKDYQFRVYNGSQVYHDPVTIGNTTYYFKWGDLTGSGTTADGKYIVKVFDGDSESLYVKVYLNKSGKKTTMKRCSISGGLVDACASSYLYNFVEKNTDYLTAKQKIYWYASGNPSTDQGWSVTVELTNPDGTINTYESSNYQSDYEGFK